MINPYTILGAVAVAVAIAGVSAWSGWQARAVLAERDALRLVKVAADDFRKATSYATEAADSYNRRRDALQPEIRIIRTEGRTIVRELDTCPLPADAGRLLNRAADAADNRARTGNPADAAGAEDHGSEPVSR